jgi:hypothetical protein
MSDQGPQEPTVPIAPVASARPARRPPPSSLGIAATLLAGVVLAVAPFLGWFSLGINARGVKPARAGAAGDRSITGLHLPDGRLVLALGIAVLVVALVIWAARSDRMRSAGSIVVLALGAVATTVAAANLAMQAQIPGLAEISLLLSRGGGRIGGFLDRVAITKGPGLWLALIGGLVAIVAGVAGVMSDLGRGRPET